MNIDPSMLHLCKIFPEPELVDIAAPEAILSQDEGARAGFYHTTALR
jgi:hypothetical protein